MTIPLFIFLYIYLFFLLIWLIFSCIIVYHINKYSIKSLFSISIVGIYIGVSLIILLISGFYINDIDWNKKIQFEIMNFDNIINLKNQTKFNLF